MTNLCGQMKHRVSTTTAICDRNVRTPSNTARSCTCPPNKLLYARPLTLLTPPDHLFGGSVIGRRLRYTSVSPTPHLHRARNERYIPLPHRIRILYLLLQMRIPLCLFVLHLQVPSTT